MSTLEIIFRIFAASQTIIYVGVSSFMTDYRRIMKSRYTMIMQLSLYLMWVGALWFYFAPFTYGIFPDTLIYCLWIIASLHPVLLFVATSNWIARPKRMANNQIQVVTIGIGIVVYGGIDMFWFQPFPHRPPLLSGLVQFFFLSWALRIAVLNEEPVEADSQAQNGKRLLISMTIVNLVILLSIYSANKDVKYLALLVSLAVCFLIGFGVNLTFLNLNNKVELIDNNHDSPDLKLPVLEEVQIPVVEILEVNRMYATHGLKIADVSRELGVPEYRLREVIIGALGYKNFNQFVNSIRIKDASTQLINKTGLPILSIALDVGFSSITSFNKSFFQKHGCTPTEFRTRYLNEKYQNYSKEQNAES